MKDIPPNIGHLIEGPAARDAIHIAVAPVRAGVRCDPGVRVGMLPDGSVSPHVWPKVGVIDPYLESQVEAGQQVWLFMFPGTVTGLRHEWSHPAFERVEATAEEKAAAEQWVRNYAAACNVNLPDADEAFDHFMREFDEGLLSFYGTDCVNAKDAPDAENLFKNLSIMLGRRVGPASFRVTCSC